MTEEIKKNCAACKLDIPLNIDFEYAFQPILNIQDKNIWAYEALIRGKNGESAYSVLSQVNESNQYYFDQACRVKAVKTAAALGMTEMLSINFLPNAVYEPSACIRTTLEACRQYNFSTKQIMFEVVEAQKVVSRQHLINIFESYKKFGFATAIDDFGAGYAGLNLLSGFQPHVIKIDMDLIRNIDNNIVKQAIVKGVIAISNELGIKVIAEGVETKEERDCIKDLGIILVQGYYYGKPLFQSLTSQINWD